MAHRTRASRPRRPPRSCSSTTSNSRSSSRRRRSEQIAEEFKEREVVGRAVAVARGDDSRPRRPRQDVAARPHPQHERRRRARPAASRRPQRLPRPVTVGDGERWSRSSTRPGHEAFTEMRAARREGDGHRRARRRRRRRRHAADGRVDQPRQGGRSADHRRAEQDRQARSDATRTSSASSASLPSTS